MLAIRTSGAHLSERKKKIASKMSREMEGFMDPSSFANEQKHYY